MTYWTLWCAPLVNKVTERILKEYSANTYKMQHVTKNHRRNRKIARTMWKVCLMKILLIWPWVGEKKHSNRVDSNNSTEPRDLAKVFWWYWKSNRTERQGTAWIAIIFGDRQIVVHKPPSSEHETGMLALQHQWSIIVRMILCFLSKWQHATSMQYTLSHPSPLPPLGVNWWNEETSFWVDNLAVVLTLDAVIRNTFAVLRVRVDLCVPVLLQYLLI